MKKLFLIFIGLLFGIAIHAQQEMRIWSDGESKRVSLSDMGNMLFSDGKLTLGDTIYTIADIDSIVPVQKVYVSFSADAATVDIPAALADSVSAEINGAYVTLTNKDISNEIDVILSGASDNGGFTYNGSYKVSIILNGLSLTSQQGAALDIKSGKRVDLELVEGTVNTLVDYASGEQKGALYCKGHMEVSGAGSLSVTGNAKHAICTKEYLQLKKSTGAITIVSAASDAIHAGQYFQMNGGTLTVDGSTMGDGIQVETAMRDSITEEKDTLSIPDLTKNHNGQIIIKGGTINMDIDHEDCKGLKCDSLVTISGGTIAINANAGGSRGIQSEGNMTISEISGDDNPTSITINVNGRRCTNPEHTDDHRCIGMRIKNKLTVTDGKTIVKWPNATYAADTYQIRVGAYEKTGGSLTGWVTYSN